jgi:ureidoglycolate lyase
LLNASPTSSSRTPASRAHRSLPISPLTAQAFAPYGDVIEATDEAQHFEINQGFAERYHDLARIDVARSGGRPVLSVFRAKPRGLPLQISLLERHPLGSQTFFPLSATGYLVVVALGDTAPDPTTIQCFHATNSQGINYSAGIWHHPLIALGQGGDFLVVDRGGAPEDLNCDECTMDHAELWLED